MILKREQVQIGTIPSTSRASLSPHALHAAGASSRAKSVRLIEHAGVAHAIEITCTCGEITLVELGAVVPGNEVP